jgi:hypothetical protein
VYEFGPTIAEVYVPRNEKLDELLQPLDAEIRRRYGDDAPYDDTVCDLGIGKCRFGSLSLRAEDVFAGVSGSMADWLVRFYRMADQKELYADQEKANEIARRFLWPAELYFRAHLPAVIEAAALNLFTEAAHAVALYDRGKARGITDKKHPSKIVEDFWRDITPAAGKRLKPFLDAAQGKGRPVPGERLNRALRRVRARLANQQGTKRVTDAILADELTGDLLAWGFNCSRGSVHRILKAEGFAGVADLKQSLRGG